MTGTYHANDVGCDARWGARLIAREIDAGACGLVYNRQAGVGDTDTLIRLMDERAVVDRACETIRDTGLSDRYRGGDDRPHVVYRDDDIIAVASAQGSWGYVYLSVLLHPDPEWTQQIIEESPPHDG